MDCDKVCAKITRDLLFNCDDIIYQGIEQQVMLVNRCDIQSHIKDITNGDPGAFATGILTFTGQPAINDTVTIDSVTYTFTDTIGAVANFILIGASVTDSITNLVAAINGSGTPGVQYSASTEKHPTVRSISDVGDTMVAIAKDAGSLANAYATTSVGANISWTAATLLGGIDPVAPTHKISNITLNPGAQGYLIQGVNGKNIFTGGHSGNINEDAPNDYVHTLALRAYNLTEENLTYVRNLGKGADVIAITMDRGASGEDFKYKVYGIDFGLKVSELTHSSGENRGAVLYTLASADPDFETFPPFVWLESDLAFTDAKYEARLAV